MSYVAAPANTWNIHLQVHDDLLLVIHAKDMFAAAEFADERAYYSGALGKTVGTAEAKRARDWSAGLAVYDISKPEVPRRIGFMGVEGGGIHRIWYTGGRWAYVSMLLDGFTDYIFMTVDMTDPAHPHEAGRWWISGMNLAAGETPSWAAARRYGLHHAIIHGDRAYAAWRDAGMVVLDIADRSKPKLIVHRSTNGPRRSAAARTIVCRCPTVILLVVLDEAVLDHQEDGLKLTWVFDNRVGGQFREHIDLPDAGGGRLQGQRRSFRSAQCSRNRPGSFVVLDLDFRHLSKRRHPRVRSPIR